MITRPIPFPLPSMIIQQPRTPFQPLNADMQAVLCVGTEFHMPTLGIGKTVAHFL